MKKPPQQPFEAPEAIALSGDARSLATLRPFFPASGFDVILTSPPYWRRRDYDHPDQLGQEATAEMFVDVLSRTVEGWADFLSPHGSAFINLADTAVDGFLAGIPTLFEQAMLQKGWKLAHRIVWSKTTSVPQPSPSRLTSRHEVVLHLIPPKHKSYYFDRFALAQRCPNAEIGDVWHLASSRGTTGHPAPFPAELAKRVLALACPEQVCTACGKPFQRITVPSPELDLTRPQAVRAMQKFTEAGLTEEHLTAIRAVGISDAGMGKKLQKGAGRNDIRKQALADEAKAVLGGYFREFTFAPKQHAGWERCECHVRTRPGCVLDPFSGSNTTLLVAKAFSFSAVGIDLTPHPI